MLWGGQPHLPFLPGDGVGLRCAAGGERSEGCRVRRARFRIVGHPETGAKEIDDRLPQGQDQRDDGSGAGRDAQDVPDDVRAELRGP
ncbi:hypothetical protein JCM9533A_25260 [Catenuloplanes niger JCM 9533]